MAKREEKCAPSFARWKMFFSIENFHFFSKKKQKKLAPMSLRCFQRLSVGLAARGDAASTRSTPVPVALRRRATIRAPSAREERSMTTTTMRATSSSSPLSSSSTSSEQEDPSTLAASFFNQGDSRPILLYDAKCNLCNGGVDVARALDRKGDAAQLRFAALQSPAGRALLVAAAKRSPDDISSVVFVESPDTAFIRSEAVVRAAKAIGAPPALLAAALAGPLPLKARDSAYDAVADNRYSLFGKSDEERWTREGEEEGRFLV